ncbi:hypothetical protein HEP84_56555 [Streptomyces sp. RLB1-33]
MSELVRDGSGGARGDAGGDPGATPSATREARAHPSAVVAAAPWTP